MSSPDRQRPIDKEYSNAVDALSDVDDGATVLASGFGDSGVANVLLEALVEVGARELTVVANNSGSGESGLAVLFKADRVRRIICSYPRSRGSIWFDRRYEEGRVTLEVIPQGILTERIRAAGAGIAAFFTPIAAGTEFAVGKELRTIAGTFCSLEYPLGGDVALIRARAADRWGNLVYHSVARNYGPTMAAAAKLTVVEVEEAVLERGGLDPEQVVTPGLYVDRIVHAPSHVGAANDHIRTSEGGDDERR